MWFNDHPKDIDLGNLQILHIIDDSCLQYIFELYPPQKLHQLKELIIEKCEELDIVFCCHFNEDSTRTNFQSLSKLELKSLPKLRKIYYGPL